MVRNLGVKDEKRVKNVKFFSYRYENWIFKWDFLVCDTIKLFL